MLSSFIHTIDSGPVTCLMCLCTKGVDSWPCIDGYIFGLFPDGSKQAQSVIYTVKLSGKSVPVLD